MCREVEQPSEDETCGNEKLERKLSGWRGKNAYFHEESAEPPDGPGDTHLGAGSGQDPPGLLPVVKILDVSSDWLAH
jgi:hypothetical protein